MRKVIRLFFGGAGILSPARSKKKQGVPKQEDLLSRSRPPPGCGRLPPQQIFREKPGH